MRLILILIWIVVTCLVYVWSRRKATRDTTAPRGFQAWRPMVKALFHAALISGLIVFVGGSVAIALLTGHLTMSR